jgi:hypothetical protein
MHVYVSAPMSGVEGFRDTKRTRTDQATPVRLLRDGFLAHRAYEFESRRPRFHRGFNDLFGVLEIS